MFAKLILACSWNYTILLSLVESKSLPLLPLKKKYLVSNVEVF